MSEKIAVAGAGMVGAYLHRLLRNQGTHADLFDLESHTRCGLTPCAWGTSRGFAELVAAAGLDPEQYILRRIPHVIMDDVRIRADLMTFDKPGLLRDLLEGAEIRYGQLDPGKYDRVVDATGAARAFLPRVANDILLPCTQSRIHAEASLGSRVRLGGIGYAWCFPLYDRGFHLGCGSLFFDPETRLDELGWVETLLSEAGGQIVCQCSGKIRLTGPHHSRPFVAKLGRADVWGVGEAIGCVAPLAGDGVVPGMRSAQIMVYRWDDPQGYGRDILTEFRWMGDERAVVDKLIRNQRLSVSDALVLRGNSKRMGMEMSLSQSIRLMGNLQGNPR